KANYLSAVYDRNKWNWIAYGQIAYKPTTTLSIETSFFYSTRFLNEFLIIEPLGNLNFAVAKTFLERKLRVAVNFSDVFHSNNTKARIDYQDIHLSYLEKNETRSLRLALSYSFGNQKLKAARNRPTGADTETNRVKTN
ncbi:MAG TPA: outer membrane beta-barrel protein, partial [Chitinophagaceae bacterium]|nr:outer membrane beta-barrel protein [Chitinophagaceae bacterium]